MSDATNSDIENFSVQAVLAKSQLLFNSEQISAAIDTVAAGLNQQFKDESPVVLCVMNGGIIFTAYLLTRLEFDLQVDYIHATRYKNGTVGDELDWLAYPKLSLAGRKVLILDDILDEGMTLKSIIQYCESQGSTEVVSAVLLQKNHNRLVADVDSDYVALEVEDKYVFGFGMDYHGHMRHLASIYAITE